MNYENMRLLKRRLSEYHAGSLLDVAVGRGEFLKFALESFNSWHCAAGIDDDPLVLDAARKYLAGLQVILIKASALSMPFTKGYFDTITMSNALHHIENTSALFMETCRVCKQKGLVVINEMLNEENTLDESYMLYHRMISDVDHQLGRYHRETFTLKEMLSLIKGHNLDLLDYFIHAEDNDDRMNSAEIEAIVERLKNRVAQLKGSDYYYFYENKVRDVIQVLKNNGIQRPRHVTFLMQNQ